MSKTKFPNTPEVPFPRLTDRQRKLMPLDDQSSFNKLCRTWVVPAISCDSPTAPGRSHSHGDNQRPSSGKASQRTPRHLRPHSSSNIEKSSRRKKSKKSEKKCHIQYTCSGSTSDYQKQRVSLTGLSLVPDPYLELNRDLQNPLKPAANSPAWMVVATQRLRERMKASTGGSYQLPGCYQTFCNTQSLARYSDESLDSDHAAGDSRKSADRRNKTELPDGQTKAKDEQPLWEVYGEDGQLEYITDDMDEDDEEEGGLPQAVKSLRGPAPVHLSQREVTRERQKARMEDIARSVSPELLIEYLTKCGFLSHNYQPHCRTGGGNHYKNGRKKPTAQLLNILSKQTSFFK